MLTKNLAGQAMAKQKVLPFGKLHRRGFFTRERDDSFSPASRGTEMSVSVCVGLWLIIMFPIVIFINRDIVLSQHPSLAMESSNGKAYKL